MHKIFIDGREGTTGLQIQERLEGRADLELCELSAEKRKDPAARKELINQVDFVVTCLPDAAARESASLLENPRTRLIDPSSAHRVSPDFVYGFPELGSGQRDRIKKADRVTVPGCHASGFVAALAPLVSRGLVPKDYPVVAHSLTGYSGAGKKLIAVYDTASAELREHLRGSRPYALGLRHKHLPEMQRVVGLDSAPIFEPVVGNFYKGMLVSVPLFTRLLPKKLTPRDVHEVLAGHYQGERFVVVQPLDAESLLEDGYLDPLACNDTNRLELFVFGHEEQILLVARLDNLGKGASGAAVQCLNLMLGVDEATGLS
ncbi:MAG TPA: N-acetyl-gamma-glutamyl-phosphate reductase [Polyangiaceae bacterium]|jgi:N-acetyl-gamma-glutamyl-phosphate reductase|nr:N-acetyl-gamma-glutamyl-phosphate reductase [Polyangiaceae bacterium]